MTDYNELVKCGECKFWSETEKGFGRCLKSGFKTPKDFLGEDGERKDQGMTDYTKLVEALRHCNGLSFLTCRECQYNNDMLSCEYRMLRDAADAIEELQQIADHHEQTAKDYWKEACEYKAQLTDYASTIEKLQAENPIVETVLVDKLRQRIDELEEKQTYCDAYGDKWMTSGKDVPAVAYKHGYADGWDEAMAKMEVQDG